jgi:hypothetical protein
MTRKLTDEQVKAIKKGETVRIPYLKAPNAEGYLNILVSKLGKPSRGTKPYWLVRTFDNLGDFSTAKEAITFIEHLLNQRYCWLPHQQSWIMSGEVYNFANNGANKVLELMHINDHFSYFAYWMEYDIPWFLVYGLEKLEKGCPTPKQLSKGITIPSESPIWDAVKEVEAQEYTHKEGVNQ